jgi:hypothetical protein
MSCSPAVTLLTLGEPMSHMRPLLKRSVTIFRLLFGLPSSSFLIGVLDHYDLLPSHPLHRCLLSDIVTSPNICTYLMS